MSARAKNAYSTVSLAASCVMVIVGPQPLPMSPERPGPPPRGGATGAPPAGAGAGVAAGRASVVHRPEKSGLVCARTAPVHPTASSVRHTNVFFMAADYGTGVAPRVTRREAIAG